jgi:hypothetical protein
MDGDGARESLRSFMNLSVNTSAVCVGRTDVDMLAANFKFGPDDVN